MEVADTEAVATLVGATSVVATLLAVTLVVVTSAEAGPISMLAAPTCTLAGPMFASPEAATSGTATVGPADIGVMADSVMADSMTPAPRTAGLIRTATGRNELNVHLALHESSRLFPSVPTDDGRAIRVALRDHLERGRKGAPCIEIQNSQRIAKGLVATS
jgi:hypothetical protein